jgi:hypothetical protein
MNLRAVRQIVGFVVAFALLGALLQALTRQSASRDGSAVGAPPNTVRLKGEPHEYAALDPNCPSLLLLGSSQLGTVTSATRGGQVTWEHPRTTIDLLATRSQLPRACFVRVALGAILPAEMATFAAYQVTTVAAPKLVILELHWESLAHDNSFREAPRHLLANRRFREAFFRDLEAAAAPPAFVAALRSRAREVDAVEKATADKPLGARLDEPLLSRASELFPWFASIRTQTAIFRLVMLPIMGLMTQGSTTNVHPVVPTHLQMNLDAARGLAAYLKHKNVPFLVYFGPRRHDLPPMTALRGEAEAIAGLQRDFERLGATVLDFREAIPDDQFGWVGDNPDRMHFGLAGHQTIAERLLREGRAAGLFAGLEAAR